MLKTKGLASSIVLSRELDIPLSTVQRRKRILESTLVDSMYELNEKALEMERAVMIIECNGDVEGLISQLAEIDNVIDVRKALGGTGMVIIAHVIYKTTRNLLALVDMINNTGQVKKLEWFADVTVHHRKNIDVAKLFSNKPT